MAEYIEREALLKFIENGLNNPDRKEAFGYDAVEILEKVQYMPAADVSPVRHGRWEDEHGGKYANPRYRCSVCKERALYKFERDLLDNWKEVQALTPNCPNCGAKMGGGVK